MVEKGTQQLYLEYGILSMAQVVVVETEVERLVWVARMQVMAVNTMVIRMEIRVWHTLGQVVVVPLLKMVVVQVALAAQVSSSSNQTPVLSMAWVQVSTPKLLGHTLFVVSLGRTRVLKLKYDVPQTMRRRMSTLISMGTS